MKTALIASLTVLVTAAGAGAGDPGACVCGVQTVSIVKAPPTATP